MTKHLTPPNDPEAEQSVLGATLLRSSTLDQIVDFLTSDDFYYTGHGQIFQAILDLWNQGKPVDITTVKTLLKERGELEKVGGFVFLADLYEQVGTAANAPFYAKIVKDKARLRTFLDVLQQITKECFESIEDVDAFLDQAEGRLFQIIEKRPTETRSMAEIVPGEKARIEALHDLKDGLLGPPTGFIDLNKVTGGWQPGDLILLAARPSMGKTALATNLALGAGCPVAFFSLEMSCEQLVQRFMANLGKINATRLRTGKMEPEEWVRFMDLEERLIRKPIFINDSARLTPLELRAQARRLTAKHRIGLVIVDYLQLMSCPGAKSREQEVSQISRSLKALAKELHVPVIALSQLNREVEKRSDRRPIMSDLRDSGSLEQDADLILFIYRDEIYREDSPDIGTAEINVAKHRMGPTRKFKLAFQPEFSRFVNYQE